MPSPQQQHGNTKPAEDIPKSLLDQALVRWTAVIGVFTVVLAIAAMGGIFFTWQEWKVARETAAQTREQMRAVVSFSGVNEMPATDRNKHSSVGFSIIFTNYGATRTAWARGWANFHYFPTSVPPNFDLTRQETPITGGNAVIAANSIMTTGAIGPLQEEEAEAAKGHGTMIIWGAIDYADIFDPIVTKHSSFCQKLVPSGTATNSATKQNMIAYQPVPYRDDCNKSQ